MTLIGGIVANDVEVVDDSCVATGDGSCDELGPVDVGWWRAIAAPAAAEPTMSVATTASRNARRRPVRGGTHDADSAGISTVVSSQGGVTPNKYPSRHERARDLGIAKG
ncbi:MAG TPA: hypothetical protein VFR41_10555 [Acidimicrobiia bacterium]|nr:hypothetical protein [Acidimicrobiia bacterium]